MEGTQILIPVSVAMLPDMARKMRVLAAIQGKSRSQLIRDVLEKFLSNSQSTNLNQQEEGICTTQN